MVVMELKETEVLLENLDKMVEMDKMEQMVCLDQMDFPGRMDYQVSFFYFLHSKTV